MSSEDLSPGGETLDSAMPKASLVQRLRKSLGPALPAIVLDLADALSLTRYASPFVSFPVGFGIGVWLSLYYPFTWKWRALIALGSGLYTLTPGTEAIPLATMLTCLGRFIESAPVVKSAVTNTAEQAPKPGPPVALETTMEEIPAKSQPARRGPSSAAICPECGSSSLQYGEVAQRFYPVGKSLWSKGHELNAFVCLECGFVGHYLATNDLDRLRQTSE